MSLKVIGYWVTTAILVFGVLSGGVAELVHRRENVESIVRLGYPVSSSPLKRKHRAPVSLLNRGTERQASLLVMSHRRGFFRQGYDEVMEEREGMEDLQWLAERFEENRGHLRAVAYRMLGSASEADDAIQETWLRLGGSDASSIENLGGWLTTVVARVCLDMLRSRTSRREEALDTQVAEAGAKREGGGDPEREALLADSVGLALLVVLDRLTPAERLAFVMHDMFAVPFEEIAPIVGRSLAAARQPASRARRRVQGAESTVSTDLTCQREVVNAFVAALRGGDFKGLLAVLDPDVVVRVDRAAAASGRPTEVQGARNWANGAIAFAQAARFAQPALVDGEVGVVLAPGGRLRRVLRFIFMNDKIAEIEVVADPARLHEFDLAVLNA